MESDDRRQLFDFGLRIANFGIQNKYSTEDRHHTEADSLQVRAGGVVIRY